MNQIKETIRQYIEIYGINECTFSVVDGIASILKAHYDISINSKELENIINEVISD